MIVTVLRRSMERIMLLNIVRRILFIVCATLLVFAWIIGGILAFVMWPIVWVLTGRCALEMFGEAAIWLEESIGNILPEKQA